MGLSGFLKRTIELKSLWAAHRSNERYPHSETGKDDTRHPENSSLLTAVSGTHAFV
jgi:hypothetical protein